MALYASASTSNTFFDDEYFANRIWTFVFTAVKTKALTSATRLLDRQGWKGAKTDSEQELQWPRTNVSDPYGKPIDPVQVPQFMKDATCLLAMQFVLSLADPFAALFFSKWSGQGPAEQDSLNPGALKTEAINAGTAAVRYLRSTSGTRFKQQVFDLVGFYIIAGGGLASAFGVGVGGGVKPGDPPQEFS